jgi:hypothetical protein
MSSVLFSIPEDTTHPPDIPVYIPDQELYPGQTFNSFPEMQKACPEIFVKQDEMDEMGLPYTPYRCHYVNAQGAL